MLLIINIWILLNIYKLWVLLRFLDEYTDVQFYNNFTLKFSQLYSRKIASINYFF